MTKDLIYQHQASFLFWDNFSYKSFPFLSTISHCSSVSLTFSSLLTFSQSILPAKKQYVHNVVGDKALKARVRN